MKALSYIPILIFCSMLATQKPADADEVTPAQTVDRAPQSLQDLHGAIDNLRHPPDYVSAAYVSAYTLMQAADEYVVRKEPVNAALLYNEALAGLRDLQNLRPDWQPKMVSYRISKIDQKIKDLASQTEPKQKIPLTVPGVKQLNPNQSLPGGWREFEFNGQKYYYVPLTSVPDAGQKVG